MSSDSYSLYSQTDDDSSNSSSDSSNSYHQDIDCVIDCDKLDIYDNRTNNPIWYQYSYKKRVELLAESYVGTLSIYPNYEFDNFGIIDAYCVELCNTFNEFDFSVLNKFTSLVINNYDAPILDLNNLTNIESLKVTCTGELLFDKLVNLDTIRLIYTNVREIPPNFVNLFEIEFKTKLNDICLDMTYYVHLEKLRVVGAKLINLKNCTKLRMLTVDHLTDINEIVELINIIRATHYTYYHLCVLFSNKQCNHSQFKEILNTMPDVNINVFNTLCIDISIN